jgi:transcriptional regulator of acetoin/glycerol metabolism
MQVKLLRAIQEKKVRKVGSTQEDPVDVRIISATHQKLGEWRGGSLFTAQWKSILYGRAAAATVPSRHPRSAFNARRGRRG